MAPARTTRSRSAKSRRPAATAKVGRTSPVRDHREELRRSAECGCFHCLGIYPFELIEEWVDGGETAICPECGIDSVIGSASGFPIETYFLERMRERWFGR